MVDMCEHFSFPLSLKSLDKTGSFAGYASVFHVVDGQADVLLPGAFRASIETMRRDSTKQVKLLWQHRADEPIGVFTLIREDAHGLYVEGRLLLDVARGKEAYSLLKSNAVNGLSIGYRAIAHHVDEKSGIRYLSEVELWEISLVTFPANPEATITQVKQEQGNPSTVREFEQLLRNQGFSRKDAKRIALYGFKANSATLPEEEWLALGLAVERGIAVLSL